MKNEKMSEARSGEKHWNFGKETSQETKEKISKTLKEKFSSGELTRSESNEQKKKISESLMKYYSEHKKKSTSFTEESKQKMREIAKNREVAPSTTEEAKRMNSLFARGLVQIISPDGVIYKNYKTASDSIGISPSTFKRKMSKGLLSGWKINILPEE